VSGLVSIVLPTYTRAQLLPHAIRSVLAQTYRDFELIIVDDNSRDDTPGVVRAFDDPRIRYVRNEKNLKLPGALNKGFALARGRFLTWTSDDNLYAPDAIERMVAVLEAGGCDLVFADYYDFARHDEKTGAPLEPRRIGLPREPRLEERNSVGACFLYTRAVYERIGDYDTELFLVEDYDYFIRIQKAGFSISHIPEPLYYFSRHDDALFCTRFAEVQAAGILVRYKNALLDEEKAAQACVRLVTRDLGALNNPLLRSAYLALKKTSFTLTGYYERIVRAYIRRKIGTGLRGLLDRFSSRAMSFPQTKDALKDLLQAVAKLEYKSHSL
jgi:glycosyltransferase involved in cell wall biosynthesis